MLTLLIRTSGLFVLTELSGTSSNVDLTDKVLNTVDFIVFVFLSGSFVKCVVKEDNNGVGFMLALLEYSDRKLSVNDISSFVVLYSLPTDVGLYAFDESDVFVIINELDDPNNATGDCIIVGSKVNDDV